MRRIGMLLMVSALLGASLLTPTGFSTPQTAVSVKPDYALKQAQREMAMLDDIYKTSIVLITTHYVEGKDSLPAGSAFRKLFDSIKEKKWHEVRLLDGTGDPYNPENTPKEGFEKRAMARLLSGESKVEEVVQESGKRFLLGATAVPVVMDKCVVCHQVYADVAKGKAIGALSYKIPVQEIDSTP